MLFEVTEMKEKILTFLKKEPVLCVAAVAAVISCGIVPPDGAYLGYIDWRTLALLYCLMVVVAGARKAGAFDALARGLCAKAGSSRTLGLILTLLCFFSAMVITNDVALLTFVPFTVLVMGGAQQRKALLLTVVLETVAANLGSMLTPVGNPQNLYLYSCYDMSMGEFLSATLPLCALSLVLTVLCCLALPKQPVERPALAGAGVEKKTLVVSAVLFVLCLLVVLRVLVWQVLLPVLVVTLLVVDRSLLGKADFLLLLTFVCFFVFVGNVGRMESVKTAIAAVLRGRELLVSALASQVISNVPAAVLLSGFTDNARALLQGVNIGGLGTPIASLASLISMKIYSRSEGAHTGRYLAVFSVVNFALLILLLLAAWVMG